MAERFLQPTLKTKRVVIWFVNSTGWASEPSVSFDGLTGVVLTKYIIAVLTKPDRIEFGDEGKWLDILRNRTEIFKGGWFCTRQPGLMVRLAGVTPENARADERDFFETTRPWSNAEPDLRARLGTMALSKALSQKLFEVIAKRFANPFSLPIYR